MLTFNAGGRSSRRCKLSIALSSIVVAALALSPAAAHETDQYSVPVGREFADLRYYFSAEMYDVLEAAVEKTNARIQASLRQGVATSETKRLQTPETIAWEVLLGFPPAINYVEALEMRLRSREVTQQFPGLIVAYMPTLWIYHHWALVLDPTKLVRLWRCSTVMINGIYLGTDKIVHFAHMGYLYFSTYRQAVAAGADEAEAMRRVLALGAGANALSESGFLGSLTTGVVSNGDLAADYCGFKFFRNLTEPVRVAGVERPPLLVRDGELWRLNEHVSRDADFFSVFVSPHWDEVLNPSVYAFGMGAPVEAEIRKRCDDVLHWYRNDSGQPLGRQDFEAMARELTTYFGEDYGHQGNLEDLVTVSKVCFPREDGSDVAAAATRARSFELASYPPKAGDEGRDALGRTALFRAARAGQVEDVRRNASAGAVDLPDADGETGLHAASRSGHRSVAEVLVSRGADVNATAAFGQTPLHLAARAGHAGMAEFLLQHGARPAVRDAFGCTPLHDAAAQGHRAVVDVLLAAGAPADEPDAHGSTPLHVAARRGHADIVQRLLTAGANPKRASAAGKTPLDEARFSKDRRTVELLRPKSETR